MAGPHLTFGGPRFTFDPPTSRPDNPCPGWGMGGSPLVPAMAPPLLRLWPTSADGPFVSAPGSLETAPLAVGGAASPPCPWPLRPCRPAPAGEAPAKRYTAPRLPGPVPSRGCPVCAYLQQLATPWHQLQDGAPCGGHNPPVDPLPLPSPLRTFGVGAAIDDEDDVAAGGGAGSLRCARETL